MKVRIKDREWFEKNCYIDKAGYYYRIPTFDGLCFNEIMKENCGKVIELDHFSENGIYRYEEWMYDVVTEKQSDDYPKKYQVKTIIIYHYMIISMVLQITMVLLQHLGMEKNGKKNQKILSVMVLC